MTKTVNEVQSDLAVTIKDLTRKFDKLQGDVDEIRQGKSSSLTASDDRKEHTKRKLTKCHYCHKPGHMRKDSFALKNHKSSDSKFKNHDDKERKASGSVGANTIGVEAGMFLRTRLQGI